MSLFKVTNATLCSQVPKMLFDSKEEPAVVFQLIQIRSHQLDQTWKDGNTTDSVRRVLAGSSVTVVGFLNLCDRKSLRQEPEHSHGTLKLNPTIQGKLRLQLHITSN